MKYAIFPAPYYECSCGKAVSSLDSIVRRVSPDAPIRPPEWRFQHGDNREAVYSLDGWGPFTREQEIDMEEWTERVHEYEKRGRQ